MNNNKKTENKPPQEQQMWPSSWQRLHQHQKTVSPIERDMEFVPCTFQSPMQQQEIELNLTMTAED